MPAGRSSKALSLALAVVCAAGFAVSGAHGAIDARLSGKYLVVGQIVSANDGSRGEVRTRIWRFRPLCSHGPCRQAVLIRQGPHGSTFRSIVKRRRPGVWRGVERKRIGCPDYGRATQKAKVKLRITRRLIDGRAAAFRGKIEFTQACPSGRLHSKAKVRGRAR